MDIERKEISRKQLYDEIWELSLAGVARKYNLNYSRFRSLCKDEDIPVPSSGYWTRKNMGKDVSGEKPELTGPPDKVLLLAVNKETKKTDKKETLPEEPAAASDKVETKRDVITWDKSRLDFLDKEERDKVLASASELRINNSSRLNRTLTRYKHADAEFKAKKKKFAQEHYNYHRSVTPDNEAAYYFKELSEAGV